ncbi:salivary acidic proline-rich phosphoprotein 1/2 isoform 1-T1 [Molossus nigricans]
MIAKSLIAKRKNPNQQIITLLKNPRRNLNTNLMKKRTIVKSMAITTRMSRTAHIAKVKKVTKTVKVTKEARMARVASVKEVSRLVSVVANDNENQPKMAFSDFLELIEIDWRPWTFQWCKLGLFFLQL